jgi:hypothetical protein
MSSFHPDCRGNKRAWEDIGKGMGCEGNHQFYLCSSDFIIDNINFVYYKFTLIIGWNIACKLY